MLRMVFHRSRCAERAHVLAVVLLATACSKEERPPYRPPPGDSVFDAGAQGDGGQEPPSGSAVQTVTPDQMDALAEWGADLMDPDKICTGANHTCAIDRNGKVWCWGRDRSYIRVPNDLPAQKLVTCGIAHTCSLDEDGVATCWGAGSDPTMIDTVQLGQSVVPDGRYKDIAAGTFSVHTCAINMDDELVCWGAGAADKGENTNANFGQARPPAGKFRNVAVGEAHSCAIAIQSGEVVCWGGEGDGRCFPPLGYACGQLNTPLGSYVDVTAGSGHSCALTEAGTIRCWGKGTSADETLCDPYNDGSLKECGQANPPDDVDAPWARITAGLHTTCAITEDYEAHCWGWNQFHQADVPERVAFAQIAPGDLHTCAIRADGMPVCWGVNDDGERNVPAMFPKP
jgi:alpha-tubulin suppressor-like RCC1 family protein